ncbi:MAG: undecaprenyldiphospho-muramoylpentapeptide beta-N-acetylglucosaminyltransferase [Aestuariivita sp.]|nr:undecaprenyldiphospho-muramoylpentapeptide beta-N-acetylglucosaminyltransferase [Aestuariivita sp.]
MSVQRFCLIAAGGTGGHLFPAQSLAEALLSRGWRVHLSTDARGVKFTNDFPNATKIIEIKSATFSRGNFAAKALVFPQLFSGIFSAIIQMKRDKPNIIVGFGGYPSIPVLCAAWLLRLPRVIHEQNGIMGKVNRFFGPRVWRVACGTWPTVLPRACKAIHIGNPVRAVVQNHVGSPYIPPGADLTHIFVMGGSQGSRILSEVVPSAIVDLPANLLFNLRISHQARDEDQEKVIDVYRRYGIVAEVKSFFGDVPQRMSSAQLVISRSGASSLAELTAIGRPSILVPYAAATADHQTANARALVTAGAAILIPEKSLKISTMTDKIRFVLSQPDIAQKMAQAAISISKPNAAEELADLVQSLTRDAAT